ncbi:MAG: HRDC domain-containing protein [Bacillota bacterium]
MLFRIVTIPFDEGRKCFIEDDFTHFVINKIIRNYQAHFFSTTNGTYWTIFIEYEVPAGLEPEMEGLSEAEKMLFDQLRAWRKEKAEQKGFPVYVICNNSQLKALVKQAPKTLEALKNIDGFGKKKLGDYGEEVVSLIKAFYEKPV